MHLFPQTGFDQSATTSVFLGVLVSWFFTETLGWVFVGLVVPGYLASLFLLDARSAGIDVLEAALTYGVAQLLGELLARTGLTSRVFGRERFLLVLTVSVLVRLTTEAVILPLVVPRASWAYSIGLVVVPLLANACWKTGLTSGLVQRGVPTLVVYLLLRFVLLPHTNLSLGGFYLATENVASSFLASPRAYLLLLTGALLAAVANVRWGWDYNGILVPALLSLTLGGPQRLLITFGESLLLVWTVRLLLQVTPVGRWNIEGPRRPVLFFTLDYALRFGLASVGSALLGASGPGELSGFGYLLPTLMAVKISRLGLAAPVLLPTASVSTAAYALGTLFGFTALKLDSATPLAAITRNVGQAPKRTELAVLWAAALTRTSASGAAATSAPLDWAELANSWRERVRGGKSAVSTPLVELQPLDDGILLLRDRFETAERRAGNPTILLRTDVPRLKTVLVVSQPLSRPLGALAAGRLLAQKQVDAVVLESEAHGAPSAAPGAAVGKRLALLAGSPRAHLLTLHATSSSEQGLRVTTRAVESGRLTETVLDNAADAPLSDVALGASLDELRCGAFPESAEERLALRRLLLEPLLARRASLSQPLLQAAAAALGFDAPRRVRLASGDGAFVLTARASQAGLAMVVRAQSGSGTVIELPRGASAALRRLGLALFAELDADALLVRPCAESDPDDGELFRAAHREAALAAPQPTSFLELRRAHAEPSPPQIALGTWGRAETLVAQTQLTLGVLGLAVVHAPLDLRAREVAGDDLREGSALVSLLIPAQILESDAWRSPAQALRLWGWLGQRDAEPVDVARELLDDWTAPATDSDELFRNAERAALEQSAVARSQLQRLLTSGAGRARLARSNSGVFLVVASRAARGFRLGSFPVAATTPVGKLRRTDAVTLDQCAALLARGGICALEESR